MYSTHQVPLLTAVRQSFKLPVSTGSTGEIWKKMVQSKWRPFILLVFVRLKMCLLRRKNTGSSILDVCIVNDDLTKETDYHFWSLRATFHFHSHFDANRKK